MNRTQTKQIHVGSVAIGGGAPVAVQSMCNTHTSDAHATIEQIARLHDAGCEIIRLAVPDQAAADALLQKIYDYLRWLEENFKVRGVTAAQLHAEAGALDFPQRPAGRGDW